MLPNHAPLQVAEQFGTLASLFPGRVDLGLGRAPGTDHAAAFALRRTLQANPDEFPRDVMELIDYFRDPQPGQQVRAVPGAGLRVPIWILGSSLFGAQVAAALGLPFSFASHFAPQLLHEAIDVYRDRFTPSEHLAAAVRDARREHRRRRHRRRGAIPRLVWPPVVCQPASRPADSRCRRRRRSGSAIRPIATDPTNQTRVSFVGAPATIADQIDEFIERDEGRRADRGRRTSTITRARLRSYELAAAL